MKYYAFVCFALITACGQPSQNNGDTFIVPVLKKPTQPIFLKSEPPPPPPPERAYYFGFNFIVDSTGDVFYFQLPFRHQVDGDGQDDPPPFINLQPKDLVRLPASSIGEFMCVNILSADDRDRRVSLASQKDTFTSAGVAQILPFLNDTANHINWLFRKTTLEENTVLDYKRRGAYYDAEDIRWDSTKIRFAPNFEGLLKFTPLKFER